MAKYQTNKTKRMQHGTMCAATLSDPAWQCEVYSDRGAATYDEWKVGLQKAATVLNPAEYALPG